MSGAPDRRPRRAGAGRAGRTPRASLPDCDHGIGARPSGCRDGPKRACRPRRLRGVFEASSGRLRGRAIPRAGRNRG
ncbi:protein of unassigned function [Methylobacterium oryzae CBMB20]|uniref:Protein of unassigned function n=1 Tax=Methylobacterium oryzae CBMB20 TaxID=693986 RepID=A0A089NWR6_9HYPH|nr:protein of unassigned function [Methylobacterium oryzae CBMB20]